ncbi:hypothetical protein CLOM_g8754 [Closterium sp. NIES-68]|nr:hypothetical protein CLOM_g8754 [Closterium sp. NIES-68]
MATSRLSHTTYLQSPQLSPQRHNKVAPQPVPACRIPLATRCNTADGYHLSTCSSRHGARGCCWCRSGISKAAPDSIRTARTNAGRPRRAVAVVCSGARAGGEAGAEAGGEAGGDAEGEAVSLAGAESGPKERIRPLTDVLKEERGLGEREETGRGAGGMWQGEEKGGGCCGGDAQAQWPVPRVMESQVILKDFLSVRRDVLALPSGLSSPYLTVFAGPLAVAVVAVTWDGKVVVNQEYRHAVGAYVLSLPGGVMDAGETPQQAAVRELEEETGFVGRGPAVIGSCCPLPGVWQQKVLFVHVRIDEGERRAMTREGTEALMRTSLVPYQDIAASVRLGVEVDGVLLAGLFFAGLQNGKGF